MSMIFVLVLAGLASNCWAAAKPRPTASAPTEDFAKERLWAKELQSDLLIGQAKELTANGKHFLALYTPQTAATPKGAVILLPGMGAHPDWPGVIHNLRVKLPAHGWSTLSLQMPLLSGSSRAAAYAPLFGVATARIQAGIAFLHKQGIRHIVLLGHGLGAAMGAWFIARHRNPGITTFVGISMGASSQAARLNTPAQLSKIHIPVLDLYGSQDHRSVTASAGARATAALRAGNKNYRQQEIAGAGRFFAGFQGEMVRDVRGWLRYVTQPGQPS